MAPTYMENCHKEIENKKQLSVSELKPCAIRIQIMIHRTHDESFRSLTLTLLRNKHSTDIALSQKLPRPSKDHLKQFPCSFPCSFPSIVFFKAPKNKRRLDKCECDIIQLEEDALQEKIYPNPIHTLRMEVIDIWL